MRQERKEGNSQRDHHSWKKGGGREKALLPLLHWLCFPQQKEAGRQERRRRRREEGTAEENRLLLLPYVCLQYSRYYVGTCVQIWEIYLCVRRFFSSLSSSSSLRLFIMFVWGEGWCKGGGGSPSFLVMNTYTGTGATCFLISQVAVVCLSVAF